MDLTNAAKFLMKQFESIPVSPEVEVGELQEVFNHKIYSGGSESERKRIMFQSSQSKYKSEVDYPWDHYFGTDITRFLQGKVVLDLGCFSGGRTVAWCERYHPTYIIGIDVKQEYMDAAIQFAQFKSVGAHFRLGRGELLPFNDDKFDAIVSFDTLEHVQDIRQTLHECYRVLKKGGKLLLVFPGYYHPTEHHLSLVTKLPFIHYIFSGRTLVKAYYEIIEERGNPADWYKRPSSRLEPWEKSNTINGTTVGSFLNLLKRDRWKIVLESRKPICGVGRNVSRKTGLKTLSRCFYGLLYVPFLKEIFLHRITFILEKR